MEQDIYYHELFAKEGMLVALPVLDDDIEIAQGMLAKLKIITGVGGVEAEYERATSEQVLAAIDSENSVVIRAYIETSNDGFFVYSYRPEDIGAYGYGKSIDDAMASFLSGAEFLQESYEELDDKSKMPLSIRGKFKVEFHIQPALRDLL